VERKQLWQHALDWINARTSHPHDQERAKGILSDLATVGELPTREDLSAYLDATWGAYTEDDQRWILKHWRTVANSPGHKFRFRWDAHHPLYTLDRLAREHDLQPVEDRLSQRGKAALDLCLDGVQTGDDERFEKGRTTLARVDQAFTHLRDLRNA
jgi:hypothetical protein